MAKPTPVESILSKTTDHRKIHHSSELIIDYRNSDYLDFVSIREFEDKLEVGEVHNTETPFILVIDGDDIVDLRLMKIEKEINEREFAANHDKYWRDNTKHIYVMFRFSIIFYSEIIICQIWFFISKLKLIVLPE